MSVYSLIYSPTGGTLRVMRILNQEFHADREIDLTAPVAETELTADDLVLIGLPSFGGRIPAGSGDRIRCIHGNGAKAVPVAVYGNRAIDDTLIEMKDLAEECGFRVAGAISAVAEHSIMRHVAQGRPDADDEQELRSFARQIMTRLEEDRYVPVPGKRPYKNFGGAGMYPVVDGCVSCGQCAENCPVGAIPLQAPDTTDKDKCICCMRCIDSCPAGARQRNKIALNNTVQRLAAVITGRKPNELFL